MQAIMRRLKLRWDRHKRQIGLIKKSENFSTGFAENVKEKVQKKEQDEEEEEGAGEDGKFINDCSIFNKKCKFVIAILLLTF